MTARWALGLACTWIAACSDDPARVRLSPIRPVAGDCGDPANPTELVVIAYTPSGEVVRTVPVDDAVPIGDFPEQTEQLGVEVRIGGAAVAIGKTAPLDFLGLRDGVTIPIFMAPPDGFCPVGDLGEPRRAPLVARAGDGVLVVGGFDAAGTPLTTAERYDPATGRFTPVEVSSILGANGFAGATLTPLPDGRVVLAGGTQPVATVYDPVTHAFAESVLIESRAFHAAMTTEAGELALFGGCSSVQAGACSGVVRLSSKLYDVTATNTVREKLPGTTLRVGRLGARIFDIGIQRDGRRTYVMAGGDPPPSGLPAPDAADLFAADATDATAIFGSFVQAAALDGGGVLTAFAPDGDPANGAASVFAPDAPTARPIARAPDLAGVRLATLENGRVVGIGGEPAGDVVIYDPMIDSWARADADGPITVAPVLHRLDDGSVLVLGGTIGGEVTAQAWIYRPPLLGPASGRVTVVTSGIARANVLVPADPATISRVDGWVMGSGGADLARALVAGPRMERGSIRIVARVVAGGIGLVAQQTGPGRALLVELVPGAVARLVRIEGPARVELCTGGVVAPFDDTLAATFELVIGDGRAQVLRDGVELFACDVGGERGAWGVAAVGAGAAIAVETVTVAR